MFDVGLGSKIINALVQAGHRAYFVGGCVRDYLMGEIPSDYDICTSAKPDEVKAAVQQICECVIDTGIKFGTVSVMMPDHSIYEVTTYRKEGRYIDNRHPESVEFASSLIEDLQRRDFTINAIAMEYPSMNIIDPFNGEEDIINKCLRCVGFADQRFREDPLRIIRGIRFAAKYRLTISDSTIEYMHLYAPMLQLVSRERILSELMKIALACPPYLLHDFCIMSNIIPELLPTYNFPQHNKYHQFSLSTHVLMALTAVPTVWQGLSDEDKIILSFAVLLHDIGKPDTFTLEENNSEKIGHFYGHAKVGAIKADRILSRLRFSTRIKDSIVELIAAHDRQICPDEKVIKRIMNKLGQNNAKLLVLLRICDIIGQGESSYEWDARIEESRNALQVYNQILLEEIPFSLKDLAINGNDLISIGFEEGKIIGRILNSCMTKVIDGTLPNESVSLLEYAQSFCEGV